MANLRAARSAQWLEVVGVERRRGRAIWKGTEVYFVSPEGKMMAAPVKTSRSFSSGTPQPLFDMPGNAYDIAGPDRFLFALPISGAQPPMTVVSDWQAAH